jgi:hypothetical protein
MTRFSSNGVPANRIGFGKNSSMEGPWKLPLEVSALTNGSAERMAEVIRTFSSVGHVARGVQGEL